jgi:hypothetical protein
MRKENNFEAPREICVEGMLKSNSAGKIIGKERLF